MLFTDVTEIKSFLPVTAHFEFSDIEPFIRSAEEDHIIPLLSQSQYNVLHAKYKEQSATALEKLLLEKVRRPLALMAYYNYIPFGNVSFGRGKISVSKNQNEEVAGQWRIEDIRRACEDGFFKGSEQMLLFLEENKSTFPLWAASTSFTQFKENFISTATEFSEHFDISGSRRIFLLIRGIMKQAEKDHIRSVTGKTLFDQIKTQIAAGNISAANNTLLEFIKPCVANFTGAIATLRLPVKWTKNGIQVLSTSFTQTLNVEGPATDPQLKALRDEANKEAEKQKKNLADYLFKNHATYPLYEGDNTVYQPTASSDPNTEGSGIKFF